MTMNQTNETVGMTGRVTKYVVREVPSNPKTSDEVGPYVTEFRGHDAWERAVQWVTAQTNPRRYAIHFE